MVIGTGSDTINIHLSNPRKTIDTPNETFLVHSDTRGDGGHSHLTTGAGYHHRQANLLEEGTR